MTEFKATKPIVAVFLAMMMVVVVATTVVSADWVTFQGNNNRNGVSTEAGPTSVSQNWSAFADTDMYQSAGIDVTPIIGDGKVYVIDYNGAVRAYYQDNGTVAWVHTPWVGHQSDFQLSTPAYNDGVLYVALTRAMWVYNATLEDYELIMGFPMVKALDTDDGSEIWNYPINDKVEITTPVTYDPFWDQVYVATWDYYEDVNSKVYCIDNLISPGTTWWIYDTGSTSGIYNSAGGSFSSDLNAIIFGNDDGWLFAVDRLFGINVGAPLNVTAAYSLPSEYNIRSSIASVPTGTFSAQLYFTMGYSVTYEDWSQDGWGHCVSVSYTYPSGFTANRWATEIGFSSSTPTVYDGRVYVGNGSFGSALGHSLYCLNAANGNVIWTYDDANGGIQASPVVYDDGSDVYVYFTTNTFDGKAYCVRDDGSTPYKVWEFLPESGKNGYILQGVALTDGKLYFGNDAGWLYAVW